MLAQVKKHLSVIDAVNGFQNSVVLMKEGPKILLKQMMNMPQRDRNGLNSAASFKGIDSLSILEPACQQDLVCLNHEYH